MRPLFSVCDSRVVNYGHCPGSAQFSSFSRTSLVKQSKVTSWHCLTLSNVFRRNQVFFIICVNPRQCTALESRTLISRWVLTLPLYTKVSSWHKHSQSSFISLGKADFVRYVSPGQYFWPSLPWSHMLLLNAYIFLKSTTHRLGWMRGNFWPIYIEVFKKDINHAFTGKWNYYHYGLSILFPHFLCKIIEKT